MLGPSQKIISAVVGEVSAFWQVATQQAELSLERMRGTMPCDSDRLRCDPQPGRHLGGIIVLHYHSSMSATSRVVRLQDG